MTRRLALGAAAYLVPTFILGFVWHLILFKPYYDALAIYRNDVIIPFGLLAMSIQSVLFAQCFEQLVATRSATFLGHAMRYAAFGAALSWSFTTITVAAKNVMTSVPSYVALETAFTLVQWLLVAPLTVAVLRPRTTATLGA